MSKSDEIVIRTSSSKSSTESEFTLRTEIVFENKTLRPGEYFAYQEVPLIFQEDVS